MSELCKVNKFIVKAFASFQIISARINISGYTLLKSMVPALQSLTSKKNDVEDLLAFT